MGFFDGLVPPDPEPQPPQPRDHHLARYTPPAEGRGEEFPPEQWFVPAWVEHIAEAGRGPEVRIMLNGWQVWHHSATLRLGVFLSRVPLGGHPFALPGQPSSGGLRCGLRQADGRRVTTLDGQPWPPGGEVRPTLSLRPGLGGAHHFLVNLHLSQLPPEGELRLVVEWPDRGVPETWTDLDAAAVRSAASRAVEVRPDLDPPRPPEPGAPAVVLMTGGSQGAVSVMAPAPRPPGHRRPMPAPPPRPTAPPRANAPGGPRPAASGAPASVGPASGGPPSGDGEGVRRGGSPIADWVRERLAQDADPDHRNGEGDTMLHVVAESGSPEQIAELARHGADVNARNEWNEETPLWRAVCRGRGENAAALLAAGATAWTPVIGERSAGWLGLRTEFASVFAELPDCVPLTDAERAEQEDADARALVFRGFEPLGLSVAFVADVAEEEVLRRLGSDVVRSPVLDVDASPGPYGTGPGGFNPNDRDTAERFLGVTSVTGGCLVFQPGDHHASTRPVLGALSPGTRVYGVHFAINGTRGHLAVDGQCTDEEIGGTVHAGDHALRWPYRLWDWSRGKDMWSAHVLGYASAMAGVRITDGTVLTRPPRRWVELPEGGPLLEW